MTSIAGTVEVYSYRRYDQVIYDNRDGQYCIGVYHYRPKSIHHRMPRPVANVVLSVRETQMAIVAVSIFLIVALR